MKPLGPIPRGYEAEGDELAIGGRAASELAAEGTPLFVYSKASMLQALGAYQRGFAGRKVQICYALKANSSLAILQTFARAGCGFWHGRP